MGRLLAVESMLRITFFEQTFLVEVLVFQYLLHIFICVGDGTSAVGFGYGNFLGEGKGEFLYIEGTYRPVGRDDRPLLRNRRSASFYREQTFLIFFDVFGKVTFGLILFELGRYGVEAAFYGLGKLLVAHSYHVLDIRDLHKEKAGECECHNDC